MNKNVPIWEKFMLSIEEAAAYFHIGENKLRQFVAENQDAPWLFRSGTKSLIKRTQFEKLIDSIDTI